MAARVPKAITQQQLRFLARPYDVLRHVVSRKGKRRPLSRVNVALHELIAALENFAGLLGD
jgi:hypothetical protein